jgi:hypothetical protein
MTRNFTAWLSRIGGMQADGDHQLGPLLIVVSQTQNTDRKLSRVLMTILGGLLLLE